MASSAQLTQGLLSKFGGDRDPSVSPQMGTTMGSCPGGCPGNDAQLTSGCGQAGGKRKTRVVLEKTETELKNFRKIVANYLFVLLGEGLCHGHPLRSAWLNCFFFPSWYIHEEVIKQVQAASFQCTTVRNLHKERQKQWVKPSILNRSIKLFWS